MNDQQPAPRRRRLDTMKVIAAFLGLSPRMVRRLAAPHRPADLRLPLFRMTDAAGPNARLYAFVDDLAEWESRIAQAGKFRRTGTSETGGG